MTYDAFLFSNELDILEIRLTELAPVVDHFVLFESAETFSGQAKPRHYEDNAARYAAWASKITVIEIPAIGPTQTAWLTEMAMRDYASRHLRTLVGAADYVLWGDVDEIPRRESLALAKPLCDLGQVVAFEQPYYLYWLNWKASGFDHSFLTRMSKGWKLDRPANPHNANFWRAGEAARLLSAGWHFSFMGGAATIQEKLASFSHQELNTPAMNNADHINACLASGADLFGRPGVSCSAVAIDSTFPHAILESQAKWAGLIK